MEAIEVAWVFEEIATLLELKGDNPYRIRAYRRAARTLKRVAGEIDTLWKTKQLETLPGIGKDLAAKIEELLSTGSCGFLEDLRTEVPSGLLTLLALPEIGPKTINTCYTHLGITSLEELEAKARRRELRKLPGVGVKTELKILKGINLLRSRQGRMPLGIVWPLAEEIQQNLALLPETERCCLTGSLRRRCDLVGDLDILLATREPERIIELFCSFPMVHKVEARAGNRVVAKTRLGLAIDLWLVKPEQYIPALIWATGSLAHYRRLRERAASYGLTLGECQLRSKEAGGGLITVNTEEEIYNLLGLEYIVPELREDRGEIEAGAVGELPKLLNMEDIKGDLHCHTAWSDGVNDLEEMVLAARKRGYHYLGITDHSQALTVARGLTIERLRKQGEEIKVLKEKYPDFQILHGAEVDILADGSLDYPEEVLKELDVVIASVHSNFRQDREEMTARIIKAISNSHVDILAHPSGRILGKREGYQVDLEQVIAKAAATRTVLEINASPERLDLNDVWARRAKECGVKIAINTDAHVGRRLDEISFGVTVARRGWLEPDDVINTWPWERVKDYFSPGRLR